MAQEKRSGGILILKSHYMKSIVLMLLLLLVSALAMAEEKHYKENPHIIIPESKPPVSAPFDQQQIALPFAESEVTNLFSHGYSLFGDGTVVIKIASRKAPARGQYARIGDYIGGYRIDRVSGTGKDYVLYLVQSNKTALIRAHQSSETHKNRILMPTEGDALISKPPSSP